MSQNHNDGLVGAYLTSTQNINAFPVATSSVWSRINRRVCVSNGVWTISSLFHARCHLCGLDRSVTQCLSVCRMGRSVGGVINDHDVLLLWASINHNNGVLIEPTEAWSPRPRWHSSSDEARRPRIKIDKQANGGEACRYRTLHTSHVDHAPRNGRDF